MNAYEMLARQHKVDALAAVLEDAGINADLAMEMDAGDWGTAATSAGVNAPSVITIGLVIATLRVREAKQSLYGAARAAITQ